jgi:hypothetical protein
MVAITDNYFPIFRSAIARIFHGNGAVVGAGFLVAGRSQSYIVTCAHVVTAALSLPRDRVDSPSGDIYLDFPLIAPEQKLTAKVVFWRSVKASSTEPEDIAGLVIEGQLPSEVVPIKLVSTSDLWEHPLRIFGFPNGHNDGVWATGILRDRQAKGWVQIEDIKVTGYRVELGFSGAPIWDETLAAVVGMAVAAEKQREDVKTAFMIPASALLDVWSELVPLQRSSPNFANPFQPLNGRIEKSEQFFSREKELRDIFEILNAGSGVELLGDRQIGKSSVLQQIKHRANSELAVKRETIYLNLQKVHTEAEFYESFCEELGIANCTGIDLTRAMKSRRVLLLLDETENLQSNGFTREIRNRLRAFAEDGSLRLVVAACTPLDRLFPDSHENGMTSPFQGIYLRVELKPWQKETVQRFVAKKLENTGIGFSDADMEKLWLESQGYPQKLMKACFYLYCQYR